MKDIQPDSDSEDESVEPTDYRHAPVNKSSKSTTTTTTAATAVNKKGSV